VALNLSQVYAFYCDTLQEHDDQECQDRNDPDFDDDYDDTTNESRFVGHFDEDFDLWAHIHCCQTHFQAQQLWPTYVDGCENTLPRLCPHCDACQRVREFVEHHVETHPPHTCGMSSPNPSQASSGVGGDDVQGMSISDDDDDDSSDADADSEANARCKKRRHV
jgi:hypothetical protein